MDFLGEIHLDGNNLKNLQLKWLREQMGLVNQEPALFTTSILENIRYGKAGDVSMKEVVHAATIASAHEFIDLLPARYKTQVRFKLRKPLLFNVKTLQNG